MHTDESDEMHALIERLTDAWNRHDPEAVAACYEVDAESEEVAVTAPLRGRHAIRNSARLYMEALPDIQFTTRRVFGAGNHACQEWTVTGTHGGELFGLEPTGRRVQVHLCRLLTLGDGGLIRSETMYWDALGLYRQLGALPPLGPTGGLFEGRLDPEWG